MHDVIATERFDPGHGNWLIRQIAVKAQREVDWRLTVSTKSYPELTNAISKQIGNLRKGIPEAMQGFSAKAHGACASGVLDEKTKELIAMGIAIALRCDGCIGFHARTLVKLGVPRQEFMEMLAVAIYMGGGPSLMYAAQALDAWEQFEGGLS